MVKNNSISSRETNSILSTVLIAVLIFGMGYTFIEHSASLVFGQDSWFVPYPIPYQGFDGGSSFTQGDANTLNYCAAMNSANNIYSGDTYYYDPTCDTWYN